MIDAVEALNEALFAWMAAGYAPQPLVLLVARIIAAYSIFVVPIILTAIWFGRASFRDRAVVAAISGGLALAASESIAAMTAHPRPFMLGLSPLYVAHAAEGSFPSAHTSLMLGVAATLLLAEGTRAWGALLVGFAVLIGWARVYIGLHFPMDIAGSMLVAALTAALLRGNYRWVAWLRWQIERVVALGVSAIFPPIAKDSARRQRVGK